ncbi:MAG TPA: SocA family protein [Candidatus Merdenecus merdavium]|nr:SocA family protein [Candidatus Merdenecus merdavium]
MCKFSEDSKQKLGNALVFIADRTDQLSKTKLLKLLYLMEEYMVKRYHVPFLALPYEVWQAGPVAKDVFIDLSDGPYIFKDFVKTEVRDNGIYITSATAFCDDEFSELEIEMMEDVLRKYGHLSASQLVAETHKEGTLWYNIAKEHGLLESFSKHECNNSDYRIDFSLALAPCVADSYRESLDIRQTATILKAGANV